MVAQRVLQNMQNKKPFKMSARIYFDRGWLPMPLPEKKKGKPPKDFTGWEHDPRKVTISQVELWLSNESNASNICSRPRRDQIGIDVDMYKSPAAGEVWEKIQEDLEEFGGLPQTWISSARDDGESGIRHFRLAEEDQGKHWPGTIADAVQFIHVGHRYAVLPPSVHPSLDKNGKNLVYQWYEPGEPPSGVGTSDIPEVDDCPILATEIVDYFTHGQYAQHLPEKDLGPKSVATESVTEWIEQHGGEPCAMMARVYDEIAEDITVAAAHDTIVPGFYRLACLAAEGHSGLSEVASRLEEAFREEVGRDGRAGTVRGPKEIDEEWLRQRDSAVKKVRYRAEEKFEFIGSACTCTGFTPEGQPKHRVDVTDYDLSDTLQACYEAVSARPTTNWFGVYHTNGKLQHLSRHGNESPKLRSLSANSLRPVVERNVEWFKWRGGDNPRAMHAHPPMEFLATMLEDHTIFDVVPEIRAFVNTPFWSYVDGRPTLIHENGYHPDVKVFMNMDPQLEESVEKMDLQPVAAWVDRAKAIIEEMIGEFPFASQADRATVYAMLCLPFMRDLIVGPTPIHLVDAPVEGNGKTLLCEAVAMVACGKLDGSHGYQVVGVSKELGRVAELEKEISARMRDLPQLLLLDNISTVLDSTKLASLITSWPMFQVREFGTLKSIEVPNRASWMATGNNVSASKEIADRILPCRIDARMAQPRMRSFERTLETWVPENRHRLVWAVLTLIASWVNEGMPTADIPWGSFDHYAPHMGGLLDCIGVPGFLTNRKSFLERSKDDTTSIDGLIIQWSNILGAGTRVSVQDVLSQCDATDDLVPADGRDRARRLGRLLSVSVDRIVAGYKLRKTHLDGRAVYFLEHKTAELDFKPRAKRREGVRRSGS
jgi:hypothetical protein